VFVLRGEKRLVLAVDVRLHQPQERDDQRRERTAAQRGKVLLWRDEYTM
jgi:hypothetical protein